MKVIPKLSEEPTKTPTGQKNGPKNACLYRPFIFPPVIQHGTWISSINGSFNDKIMEVNMGFSSTPRLITGGVSLYNHHNVNEVVLPHQASPNAIW